MKMKDLKRQSHKILPKYPFFPQNSEKKEKKLGKGKFSKEIEGY